jgi:integrase/recombinase XerD
MKDITLYTGPLTMDLDRCILEWIDAKKGRSGSPKTETAYSDYLFEFRALLQAHGLDLDSPPSIVAPLARRWCDHSKRIDKETGRPRVVAPTTYNQRRSILKSFYEYAELNEVIKTGNPMLRVPGRTGRKTQQARPIASKTIREGLAAIDRSTPQGRRDHMLLVLTLATSRRVSELEHLHVGDIQRDGDKAVIFWRGKGDKNLSNTLDVKTSALLFAYLDTLPDASNEATLWPSFSNRNNGEPVELRALQRISNKHFGVSKFHALRKSHAIEMYRRGASLAQISKDLGHADIKTTLIYLEEALADENPFGEELAEEWGY